MDLQVLPDEITFNSALGACLQGCRLGQNVRETAIVTRTG